MELPFYWVDAFTDRVFAGNPAAVIPMGSWPEDALMQRIAAQNGLSETAFFVPAGPGRAHLRWFTPQVEVDLCGHATLAAGHVLLREIGAGQSSVIFDSRSGPLSVHDRGDTLELDFPARPALPTEAPDALVSALGAAPLETYRTERVWLLVYADAGIVRALSPDFGKLSRVTPGRFIPTAPGADCDFVSRFFAPDAGVAEDPVTGSAHCTLMPYWAARLGRSDLHARQLSRRTGELWCQLTGDRVRIRGRSALYLRGTIRL